MPPHVALRRLRVGCTRFSGAQSALFLVVSAFVVYLVVGVVFNVARRGKKVRDTLMQWERESP